MPQQIDVPGMGIVEFPDGMDDNAIAAAIKSNMPAPEKPFLEKLGSFARKVYENPPPSWQRPLLRRSDAAAAMFMPGRADPLPRGRLGRDLPILPALSHRWPRAEPAASSLARLPRQERRHCHRRPAPRPSAVDPALEAAGRLGVDIPRYMATESTAIPQLAAGIKNVPLAGQPIVSSAERLTEQLGAAKRGLGAGTAETAGERAKTGLTGFIKTESQKPVSEAYKAVDELIDPAIRVPLDNTRAMVGEIMAERTAARIPGRSKAVETVFDAVQDPAGMDYKGTKGLRSFLGEKSPQELAVSGLAPTEVKRLYGALTKDLGAVVRESSPEAFGKWQEANALARLTNMQRTALSKVTGAAGDAAPEMVFNRLVGYAQSKGGADLARLRLAKRAMGPDAWNDVGSALIQRLGQAPDGQFSAQRFVTAFGNMAPAARNELFSGRQHAALQDLFTVSQYVKDRIGRFENVSGTSRGMFGGGMLTGALADPISIIGGMVGTRLLAEALARPAVVRAATAVTRAQVRGNPVATRRALQRLQEVAAREGLFSQQSQQPTASAAICRRADAVPPRRADGQPDGQCERAAGLPGFPLGQPGRGGCLSRQAAP